MNVILYMATSINGYITTAADDTSWVSPEDFAGQEKVAKRTGNIIYGKRTYKIGIQEQAIPIPNALNVVLDRSKPQDIEQDSFIFTSKSPKQVIDLLKKRGFNQALVAGGAHINRAFMKEGLVDEIYIDVEPVLIGQGLPLMLPSDSFFKLNLIETNRLNQNTLQIHYRIDKK